MNKHKHTLKAITISRLKFIKENKEQGVIAKEIADKLGMKYDAFIKYCNYYGIHFTHTKKTNCMTCANFFINKKGMPDCRTPCSFCAKHVHTEAEEYSFLTNTDVVQEYFGVAMTNSEADKFIENVKKFYEHELL